jgi:squalene-hopene/tetraprenyl-beta-curcumene cyclase
MMYHVMALDCLGYKRDHPDFIEAVKHFESIVRIDDMGATIQPCVSPVWETAYSSFALQKAGYVNSTAINRVTDWLGSRHQTSEIVGKGLLTDGRNL